MNSIVKTIVLMLGLSLFSNLYAQSFSGKTQWVDTRSVSSSVTATIKAIAVKQGQVVKKGDLLVVLDDRILALNVLIAEARLLAATPMMQQAEMDLNRAFELYDRTLLSDVELKQAEFEFAKYKAQHDVAKLELDKAKVDLNFTRILSPIDGVVLTVDGRVGLYVNPDLQQTKPLLTLVSDQVFYATARLKASQWNEKIINKPATVLFKKKKYKGHVDSISLQPLANDKGLSEYTFYVSFKANGLIPSGMPVTIEMN